MLPNLDVTSAAGLGGVTPAPAKRNETDPLTQDAYRNMQNIREQPVPPVPETDTASSQDKKVTEIRTKASEATQTATQPTARRPGTRSYDRYSARDSAEINFQMTLEEREIFLSAMSGQEDPTDMTQEEQTVLQNVSERIEKLLEEAETKSTDRGDRIDRAIKEWYNRLSNGKHKAPADLVRLIRLSAMGTGDLSNVE